MRLVTLSVIDMSLRTLSVPICFSLGGLDQGLVDEAADETRRDAHGAFRRLAGRIGEPVVRLAVRQAMRIMGHQFVMGRTIAEALARSRKGANASYRYSFDMLGEGARTAEDARRYFDSYAGAIDAIGRAAGNRPLVYYFEVTQLTSAIGATAGIAAIMVWMYWTSLTILIGAQVGRATRDVLVENRAREMVEGDLCAVAAPSLMAP